VVICLLRGADLNMAQLMPLPVTVSRLVLLFSYRLTRVLSNVLVPVCPSVYLPFFSDVNAVTILAVRAASLRLIISV